MVIWPLNFHLSGSPLNISANHNLLPKTVSWLNDLIFHFYVASVVRICCCMNFHGH